MKKLFSSILLIFLLASCGFEGSKGRNPASTLGVGESISAEIQKITPNDRSIADRICQAYRSKRFSFASILGTNFIFLFEEEECDGDVDSDQLTTQLGQVFSSSPMVFDSTSAEPYFKQVETDMHSELSEICQNVLSGDDAFNVKIIDPNTIKSYDFSRTSDGLDSYTVSLAIKDGGNDFVVKEKTEFAIRTEVSAGVLRGLVVRRTKVTSCVGEETKTNELKQTFLSN